MKNLTGRVKGLMQFFCFVNHQLLLSLPIPCLVAEDDNTLRSQSGLWERGDESIGLQMFNEFSNISLFTTLIE